MYRRMIYCRIRSSFNRYHGKKQRSVYSWQFPIGSVPGAMLPQCSKQKLYLYAYIAIFNVRIRTGDYIRYGQCSFAFQQHLLKTWHIFQLCARKQVSVLIKCYSLLFLVMPWSVNTFDINRFGSIELTSILHTVFFKTRGHLSRLAWPTQRDGLPCLASSRLALRCAAWPDKTNPDPCSRPVATSGRSLR